MDFDTLDATQAIYHDEFDDDTDEDLSPSQRRLVAYLIVQEQKGLQHKEYPVYEGDNVVGRHESCQICIPSKSLSKEHACITVKSGCHLIFDKGSRNKTKRGKLFLSPDVRYELKDQNELLFADVKCTYSSVTKNETVGVGGSETEEEKVDSPEKQGPSPRKVENSNKQSGTVLCAHSDEDDYASDASSDILLPTQPYDSAASRTAGLPEIGSKKDAGEGMGGNMSSVMETPEFLKKPFDVSGVYGGATLVLPESGSETDEEGLTGLPPQTLVFHDDDNEKTENESGILGAATRVIGGKNSLVDETQMYESEDEDRLSGSDVDMEAATQAMQCRSTPKGKGGPSKKSSPKAGEGKRKTSPGATKKDIQVERTQAYEMDVDSDGSATGEKDRVERTQAYEMDIESNSSATGKKGKVSNLKRKNLALTMMETQKMEDVVGGDDSDDDVKKSGPSKRMKMMTMETQKIEDAGDHDGKNAEIKNVRQSKKSQITAMETQKIDVTDDEDDTEEDPKALKSKAITMLETQKMDAAAEDKADENDNDDKNEDDDPQLSSFFCIPTLACEFSDKESDDDNDGKDVKAKVNFDDATQAIGDTVAFEDEEEEAVPNRSKCPKRAAVAVEDATMPIDGKGVKAGEDATMPVGADDATVAIDANDATMPINKSDATMPIDRSDATMLIDRSDATIPISTSDATMPINTGDDDDATMPMDDNLDDDDGDTAPVESKAEDDATMPMDQEPATVPISDTVPVSDTLPVPSDTLAIADTLPVPSDTLAIADTLPVPSDTLAIADTLPMADTVAIADTLPVPDTLRQTTSTRGRRGKKPPATAANVADTLPVTNMTKDDTQEFVVGGAGKNTLPVAGEEGGRGAGESAVGDTMPLAEDDAFLPLLLPQITRSSDVSDDESSSDMVPESQPDEESTSIIKLPDRSPFKSALVDPLTRSRSPSPKRVAFAEAEEPDDEPQQQTTSSRGRRRGRAARAELPSSVPRKGRGPGAKKASAADKSGDEATQAETNLTEGTVKSQNDDVRETREDATEATPDWETQASKEDKAGRSKRGAVSTAASKGRDRASEPRRSGRARRVKRFADDSEEEKEEVKESGEQKDGDTVHTSESVDQKDSDTANTSESGDQKDSETAITSLSGDQKDIETAITSESGDQKDSKTAITSESGDQKDSETAITSVPPQSRKRTPRGKAGSKGHDTDPDAKQHTEDLLQEDETAKKELASPVAPSSASSAEVKLGPSTSDIIKNDESPNNEDDTHKAHGEEDQSETETAEGHKQEQAENKSVAKRKTGRAGKRSAAQKQAGGTDTDEQAAKKAKQSSDFALDQLKHKDEDRMETEEEEPTSTKAEKPSSAEEERDEERQTRGGRGCRKSSSWQATGDARLTETEPPSGQGAGRSRGRASRQSEAGSQEDKPHPVNRGRRGGRGAKKLAEVEAAPTEAEAATTETEAAAASEESRALPATSKKSGKSVIEEEPMDTEEAPQVTADVTPGETGSARRGRAQAAKKSEEKEPETEKETATKAGHPRGRRSQMASAADVEETGGSDDRRRSRTTRGKLGIAATEADAVTSDQDTRELGCVGHTEPDTGPESSTTVSSRRRGGNKAQKEKLKEAEEHSQGSAVKRRGRHKEQSPGTDEAGETEQATASSTTRRGLAKQKDQETEEEESAGTEEEHREAGVNKTAASQSTGKGCQSKKTLEAESAETAQPSVKGRGHTRKSLRTEKETSEDSQAERDGPSSAPRGRRRVKSGSEDKEASAAEASEESSQDPTPTRRGRQTKTQSELTEEKDSQEQDHAPTRRGRQTKTQSELTEEKDSQEQDQAPTRRGRQTKTQSELTEEKDSQDQDPTPRRGRKAAKTDSDSKGDQNSQDSTGTSTSQTRKPQDKDSSDVSAQYKEEDVSEEVTPARSRGRQAKKTQNAAEDSRAQSQSRGTQESAVSHSGRRGKRLQNTDSVDAKQLSATDKEGKRGGKRRAAATEEGGSDVDSLTAESGDGLTPQKRGRKGKAPVAVTETSEKASPAPAKHVRHSGQSGSATPMQAEQKSKPEMLSTSSLRRTSLAGKPKVIFTGVIDEHGQKIVKELGGELAQSVQECTHLVTDKIRRTVKFLGGMARGVTICTLQWLESCKSSGMFVDASRFIVQDTSSEKQYKFSLRSSLHKAEQSSMLEGYRIHVTKSVRPEPQQMKEILQCAGAQWLASIPKKAAEKTVVISCEDDKNACQPALNAGIDVVSAEFILTGVLRQEVDIDGFRLFGSSTPSSRSRR